MTLFILDNSAALNVDSSTRTEQVPEEHISNEHLDAPGSKAMPQALIMLAHDALPPALRRASVEFPSKVSPVEMLEEWIKERDSGRGISYAEFVAKYERKLLEYLNLPEMRDMWPNGRPPLKDLPKWKSPQSKPRALRRW